MKRGQMVVLFALTLLAGCARIEEPAPVEYHGTGMAEPGGGRVISGYTVAVAPGETLDSIARRFDISTEALIQANRLRPPYNLMPGEVLVIPPPATYVVRRDDTVEGIARMYGVDETALADANQLHQPYRMRVGQVLSIPGGIGGPGGAPRGAAPMEMANEPPPPRSSISAEALPPPPGVATAPGSAPPPEQHTETTVTTAVATAGAISAGAATSPTVLAPPPTAPVVAAPPVPTAPVIVAPMPAAPVVQQMAAATPPPAIVTPPPAPVAPTPAAAGIAAAPHFVRPVKGQVISNYGADSGGQKNDGINIAAAAGTPVAAADAGTVVYAGNELAGFGNLVLIRHAGGWVTAYGHMASMAVQKGATVARGQPIGAVGQTGSVTCPQLHFEVRQGSKPVDPTPFLNGG